MAVPSKAYSPFRKYPTVRNPLNFELAVISPLKIENKKGVLPVMPFIYVAPKWL